MKETPIQIDGKFVAVVPGEILKAVCIPGKLVNLLTKEPDMEKMQTMITCVEEDGVKTYTIGAKCAPLS